MDFAPQELGNHLMGSSVTAGADRMTHAGARGIPQIVPIGCYDLVDFVGWQAVPPKLAGQDTHAHNRLLSSAMMTAGQRREMAQAICDRLAGARGPVSFLLPVRGGNEWDRPDGPLSDPAGLAAFVQAMRAHCPPNVTLVELDAHINDPAFNDAALQVFDTWRAEGKV